MTFFKPGCVKPLAATGLLAGIVAIQSGIVSAQIPEEQIAPTAVTLSQPMFAITVPVLYDQTPIASIDARVSMDGAFEARREDILKILASVLNKQSLQDVEAKLTGVDPVTPAEAKQAGFALVFDPQVVGLRLTTDRAVRRLTNISLGSVYDNSQAFERSPDPADFSVFLNVTAGAQAEFNDADNEYGGVVGLDGAMRFADFVLGGSSFYESIDSEFEVGSVQLIRDLIEYDVRATMGDVATTGGDLIGGEKIIGAALSHRSGRFGRSLTLTSLSAETFELDRSAAVEIYVNDTLRRRLRLSPGTYNLSEFGLTTGANEVRIVTIDDRGQRSEINLTTFSDGALLDPGEFTWEIAGGFVTDQDFVGFGYDTDAPIASARLAYGLNNQATLGFAGLGRDEGQAASLSLDTATPVGFLGVDLAGSNTDGEVGGAANLVFRPYLPAALSIPGRNFNISAFAATESFSNVALPNADNEEFRIAARLSEPFKIASVAVRSSLFGSYQQFTDTGEDRYQIGNSVSFTVGPQVAVSITSLYERDIDGVSEFSAILSLSKTFGTNIQTSASYDTDNNSGLAAVSYQNQFGGVGTMEATASAETSDTSDSAISGTVLYIGNRFNAAASHFQEVVDNDGSGDIGSNTTFTLTTALSFADGHFGISRPITDSFAIITTHPSLAEAAVTLEPGRENVGDGMRSDELGSVVANTVGSYSRSTVNLKVENMPVGYDLGQGLFEIAGPLNAGYLLQLGSDRSASATGTLLSRNGAPLVYVAGTVTSDDDPAFEIQQIFTNAVGRFVVQGLVPGRSYVVKTADAKAGVMFVTDAEEFGLNQLGTLQTNAP